MIFLDLETTGLDPTRHRILECAVLVTNDALEPIDARAWTVAPLLQPKECEPAIYEMHTASGLVAPGWSRWALDAVDGSLANILPPGTRIAGFSPHFDLGFLRVHCPNAAAHLHHRVYDCSTLCDLCADWGKPLMDKGEATHRALADCFAALQVMRRFRDLVRQQKGPS